MPEKETLERAKEDKREGKLQAHKTQRAREKKSSTCAKASTGARSTKQAIAIGLSKARRAGVKLPPPEKGQASKRTREKAKRDVKKGSKAAKKKPSAKRSR